MKPRLGKAGRIDLSDRLEISDTPLHRQIDIPTREWGYVRGGSRIMEYSRIYCRNSLMQKSIHNLMMTVVLYHLLAGCCWHHAHAQPSNRSDDNSLVSVCCGHNHAEHGHGHESPSQRPQRQDGHCDSGKCCFVVPKTDGESGAVDGTSALHAVCRDVSPPIHPPAGRFSNQAPPPAGIPPHRLHLINQVLLI